jgi:hypothetical protein
MFKCCILGITSIRVRVWRLACSNNALRVSSHDHIIVRATNYEVACHPMVAACDVKLVLGRFLRSRYCWSWFLSFTCTPSHRTSPDEDAVTYDVIGNQGPKYEVIKKGNTRTLPTSAKERKEFTLSKCAAYGPVSTPSPQGGQRNQPAEYELVQTTSNM